MAFLKALLLIPAACVGMATVLAVMEGHPSIGDAIAVYIMVALMHLPFFGVVLWTWWRPGRAGGHAWRTWAVLFLLAYGLGFGLALIPA